MSRKIRGVGKNPIFSANHKWLDTSLGCLIFRAAHPPDTFPDIFAGFLHNTLSYQVVVFRIAERLRTQS